MSVRKGFILLYNLPIAFAAWVFVQACSDGTDRPKLASYCINNPTRQVCTTYRSEVATQAFFSAVLGDWASNCFRKELEGSLYIKDFYTFRENLKFQNQRRYYSDSECKQILYTFSHSGELRAQKTTGAFDYLLDFVFLNSSITADSAEGAKLLGSLQTCLESGWEEGKTISLEKCALTYRLGKEDEESFSFKNLEHFSAIKLNSTAGTFLLADDGAELYIPRPKDRPAKTKNDAIYTKEATQTSLRKD